jgi:DNA-binding transcriptional MerR regulator
MPIKEIKKYAVLRAKGDVTLSERMEMLIQHRQSLNEQISRLQEHEAMLDEKIAFYRQEIEGHQEDTP